MTVWLVRVALIGLMCFMVATNSQTQAATMATRTVNYQMQLSPTLTVICPTGVVDLGTFIPGATTANVNVDCDLTQSRRNGNLTIVASPAQNFINLTSGAFTYQVDFSNYAYTGSPTSGSFATGITVTNPQRGTRRFRFQARPVSPIPANVATGTYIGSHTLTFSLI